MLISLKPLRVAVVAIFSATIFACAVSPTGRNQILLYSGNQMSQMGIAAYDSMKQEQKVSANSKQIAYVRCITDRLIPHLPGTMKTMAWEVNIFDDENPNAFALPGAKIGVNTGMLLLADNPAMLAAVIGHEIGHVWAQHGNERMSQGTLAQTGMTVAAVMAGEETTETRLALAALGFAAKGVVLKYSRVHESEADRIGLTLMAQAGFDPQQAVELWKKMAAKGGKNVPEFFSTHPSEDTRIKQLNRQMTTVMPIYQKALKSSS
ncbi:MAG: M48 family metallopeptidase, partial [Enterobacterales bacterium]|nr:M48 family metallopeptidase [Enterobacterales bacterium]